MSDQSNLVAVKALLKRTRRLKMAYNVSQNQTKIAAIRFSGQYLEGLGFAHDGYFDMTINEDGSIVLRAVSKEQNDIEEATRQSKLG